MPADYRYVEQGDTFVVDSSSAAEGYRTGIRRYGFQPSSARQEDGTVLITAGKPVPAPDNAELRATIRASLSLEVGKSHIFEHGLSHDDAAEREVMMRIIRRKNDRDAKFQIRRRGVASRGRNRARYALLRTA